MDLLMLGTNQSTADLAARERLAFSPEEAKGLVREVVGSGTVGEAGLSPDNWGTGCSAGLSVSINSYKIYYLDKYSINIIA